MYIFYIYVFFPFSEKGQQCVVRENSVSMTRNWYQGKGTSLDRRSLAQPTKSTMTPGKCNCGLWNSNGPLWGSRTTYSEQPMMFTICG